MSDVLDIKTEETLESNLSDDINFVETDAEVINADLVSKFEEYLGETLAVGDERRMFIQGFAYALADQLNHINETGRSNMLRYALGGELDALGDLFHNKRLGASYSTVTIRFTLSNSQSTNITIPKGTRVTPDGLIFFATDKEVVFEAGTAVMTREVTATATIAGEDHNGCAIGTINQLVDTIPYIAKVENITISGGGTGAESDDEYRERLREAPFSFSVAGPANAYKSIAMATSNSIADAAVYSPSAGVVEIAIIKTGGEIPAAEDSVIASVLAACSDKDSRPLTDKVQVVPATAVDVNINLTYYVSDTSKVSSIESAVEDYKAWQTAKIGRNIDPDELNMRMREAGATRVVITEPVYQILAENEVARIGSINIVNGGSLSARARGV